ncbi:MAG: LUD domain-containing protein, partial [Pyrinomonadaceae bacterium]|nr:LUD domain-containing protein [Phycisphaerales bacterium]
MHEDATQSAALGPQNAAGAQESLVDIAASKRAFLSRIREALGHQTPPDGLVAPRPTPPVIDESLVRLCGPEEDLIVPFTRGVLSLGMQVHETDEHELCNVLAKLISELAPATPSSVAVSIADPLLSRATEQAVRSAGRERCDWRATPGLEAQYDAAIGITDVDAGLAETGTIIVRSDALRSRGTFLVPPVHIAIIRARQILPDMLDFWKAFRGMPPTSLVFISGPSKTADIEGILITGVHGPKAVHVV